MILLFFALYSLLAPTLSFVAMWHQYGARWTILVHLFCYTILAILSIILLIGVYYANDHYVD